MRISKFWLLFAILAFAFCVRAWRINDVSMYGDELTQVYDAYSILHTGHDQTGAFFPLTFKMGAGRPGGYLYSSIPFVALFGPTEIGIRALSVVSGVLFVALIYLLAKAILGEKAAIWAMLVAAISPWDIYLSRGGFEAHFALLLFTYGVLFFIKAQKNPRFYILTAFLWGFTLLTYPTYKLSIPIFTFPLLYYCAVRLKTFRDKFLLIACVIFSLFILLVVRETIFGGSESRFASINIFSDTSILQSVKANVTLERNLSSLPAMIKPIFYNKPVEYSRIVLENYVHSLSPDFLILRGDKNPRHNPGEMGMIYLIELPLIFIALFSLWIKNKKTVAFLLVWILIAPVPTAFLSDPSHSLRNSFMLPALVMLSGYSLSLIWYTKRYLAFGVVVLFGLQALFIASRLYFLAPNKFADFWSYSARVASLEAVKLGSNKVFLSDKIDNIEFAYPVYAKIDPSLVISQFDKYPKIYGNVVIGNTAEITDSRDLIIIENRPINSSELLPGIKVKHPENE